MLRHLKEVDGALWLKSAEMEFFGEQIPGLTVIRISSDPKSEHAQNAFQSFYKV